MENIASPVHEDSALHCKRLGARSVLRPLLYDDHPRDARGWQEVPSPELSRRSLHRLRRAGRVASVAEFERERLRERTLLGLDRAKAQGKTLGRPVDDG